MKYANTLKGCLMPGDASDRWHKGSAALLSVSQDESGYWLLLCVPFGAWLDGRKDM